MTTITISATITSSVIKGGASAQPPVNTIAPVVSGSTSIGSVLSCTTGTWTGTAPITYAYQWVRGVSDIIGATSSTYTLVEADAGESVLCQVTATNIAGSSSVSSNALAIPLLLDIYPNAAVAYSVRKLRTAYSGAALRVRRSSDNAESDIGFVSNQLDTASLLSFVGTNDGFVTTWYDQSENNRNATQTTAVQQPRIVNAGVLEVSSVNKPAVRIIDLSNGTIGHNLTIPLWHTALQSYVGTFSVFQMNTGSTNNAGILISNPLSRGFGLGYSNTRAFSNGTVRIGGNSGGTGAILTNNLLYLRYDFANRINLQTYINGLNTPYINVSDNNSDFNMPTNYVIGTLLGVAVQNTSISEFIAYTTDQTSNKSGIETNINSYYSVWASGPTWDGSQSGMLNTYSGAAVAYSVRALNSTYTGPLIRVRRSSDNTEIDIFALYNGELDTTFLLNFVGAGSGFVTTWYDQSGNGNNLTQTTAANQPRIVNAGVLETQNGKVTVRFDGSNDVLSKTNVNILNNKNYGVSFIVNKWNAIPISTSRNLFYISTNTTGNTRFSLSGTTTSNYNLAGRRLDTDSAQIMASISTFNISTTNLNTSIIDYSNSDAYIYINNQLNNSNLSFLTNGNTSITNSNLMSIGALDQSNNQANANISEVIFYESSQNISAINTNINSYYNIYP